NVIKEEEASFLRTLDQGLVLLDTVIENADSTTISGVKAFELYDTFGFPIDLTALILRERGYGLDEKGFEAALKEQKDRSRSATKISTGDWVELIQDTAEEFVGYDTLEATIKIVKYRKVESKKEGEMYQLVFNCTPFYPEGGGQVGDKGYLEASNGEVVYIVDTKNENNLIVHFTKNLPRKVEEAFKAVVDSKQRGRSASNHSATHLLHQALRNVLGTHVEQKGSMVHSGSLRFDFSHFSKLTAEELLEVQDFVNARIKEELPLEEKRNIPYQQAIDEGAIALFGEKYGDAVRAIKFGNSMELCGGTHVSNTSSIWHFIITSEGAVASGIRRIEAITGDAAKQYFMDRSTVFTSLQKTLNNAQDPVKAVRNIQEENSALQKQVAQLLKDKAKNIKGDLKNEVVLLNGVNFLSKELDLDAGGLKDLAFELGGEMDNLFILFGSTIDGKALLTCYIDKHLATDKGLNAGQIVRELGKHIQGGGGGQPFFATAGGKNPLGVAIALEEVKGYLL
ncbi:MAG: alanyl-tRNA synthetase, partial [Flavobacteriales bacterium]